MLLTSLLYSRYSAKSAEGSDISGVDVYVRQLAKQASMQHANVGKYKPAGMKWRGSNATIHGVSVTGEADVG